MVGIYEHLYAAAGRIYNKDTDTDVEVGRVERLYAKVTFKITALFSEQNNDGDSIDIKSIRIKNMPAYSYLSPYLYLSTNVLDGAMVAPNANNYKNYYPSDPDSCFRGVFSFYIPEYQLSDTSKYTYASIEVNLRNDPASQREYRIVVGNGISRYNEPGKDNAWLLNPGSSDRGIADLKINRNTHYYFDASIVDFDLRGEQELELHAVIRDWDDTSLDSIWIQDYTLAVSQDLFTLPENSSFTGILNVITDHSKGWEAWVTGSGHTRFPDHSNASSTPSGQVANYLRFAYDGVALSPPDTIHIKAGKLTKKIIITN
jgi:hypothetical protein